MMPDWSTAKPLSTPLPLPCPQRPQLWVTWGFHGGTQRPFAFPFHAQPLGLLQLEVSTPLKTYFQVLNWFNQQQKWFRPSREVKVAALLSWFLPWLPLASWAFSIPHQAYLAWPSPPGVHPHPHPHPCCQHSACHPQQAVVKAENSELNNVGEASPLLMRFNLTWWLSAGFCWNNLQAHGKLRSEASEMLVSWKVWRSSSQPSPQFSLSSGLVQTGMILHMLLALLPKWELKINFKYCGCDHQQVCKEITWCAFLWKL